MKKKRQKPNFTFTNKHFLLVFILLIFILYGKSIYNKYNIDDNYVIENHKLAQQGIKAIPEIFTSRYHDQDGQYFGYRPITIAIFAVEWDVFVNILGVKPVNFTYIGHFFNIIYYILFCWLLFITLKYLFSKYQYAIHIAFITTLIFIVHPIHSEVVLSLKNREEIISGTLGILALFQTFKYFDSLKIWRLAIALISIVVAYLAKESAITFLVIIPIAYVFFKTDIRIFQWIELKSPQIHLILLLWLITFCGFLSIESFIFFKTKLWLGFQSFIPFSWSIAAFIYIIANVLIVLISKKHNQQKIFIPNIKQKTTLIIFSLALLCFVANSGLLFFIICVFYNILLTIKYKKAKLQKLDSNNIKEQTNNISFKNLSKKQITFGATILLSSFFIAIIYLAQSKALPEINAPVFKWQNPVFDFSKSTSEFLAIGFYTIGYYIKLLLIPYPLRFYYGYKVIPDLQITDIYVLLSIFILLAIIFGIIYGFNRRKPYSIGLLIFLIAIFPFANFIFPMAGVVAERLLFVPSIGFSILLAYLIILISKLNNPNNKKFESNAKTIFLVIAICLPFSILTINRNNDWKDRISLYRTDIVNLENSAKANNLYANYLIGEVYVRIQNNVDISPIKDNITLAMKHYKQAIAVDSTYANPYHNLGYIYLIIQKDNKTAIEYFDKCLKFDTTVVEAYLNRGIAKYNINLYNEAIEDLNKYMQISNKLSDKTYYYLAKSYLGKQDSIQADYFFIKLLDINIKVIQINNEIFNYFFNKHDYNHAIIAAKNSTKINPESDQPYVDIGNCYLLMGDTLNAISNWEQAFEKFNGNYNIGMTLAGYYTEKQNPEKANYYYNKAMAYRQTHNK